MPCIIKVSQDPEIYGHVLCSHFLFTPFRTDSRKQNLENSGKITGKNCTGSWSSDDDDGGDTDDDDDDSTETTSHTGRGG